MALKIVGSGLGRTGSFSLKLALEQLGFGPCHHMVEVFSHPESMPLWVAASRGQTDWDAIFEGYVSAVDYPTAGYWREIADHYPEAKVIHTERDPDAWFDSTQATIFAPGSFSDSPPPHLKAFFESFIRRLPGDIHDRAFMTDFFRRQSAEVKSTIPSERLLVLQVGEGWERLCDFLGVPVPDRPYPRENTRDQFQARVAAGQSPVQT
jgi:hypothetical protein